jgi:hypothetical protein
MVMASLLNLNLVEALALKFDNTGVTVIDFDIGAADQSWLDKPPSLQAKGFRSLPRFPKSRVLRINESRHLNPSAPI